ncbi:hypothetical protein, partial [Bradyrhizobium sp. MOS003]|uniref:hypothetical protein n=1 Tax=Bradyrhizobium sp. MOS003 TaxID=2133946 RepID=UPI000D4B9271
PSLRDGWTAYAVISREPTIPLASLAPRIWMMQSARLGSLAPSQDLTVATTARTTRFAVRTARHVAAVFPALSTEPETYERDEA